MREVRRGGGVEGLELGEGRGGGEGQGHWTQCTFL